LFSVFVSSSVIHAQDPSSSGGDEFNSNGDDSGGGGGDSFNTNSGGDNNGDSFNSNSNDDSGGGTEVAHPYPTPPPRFPCGPNALENRAWGGDAASTFLEGFLRPLIEPHCSDRPPPVARGCWNNLPRGRGKLCTQHGHFYDEQGHVVILRGVNLAGTSKIPPFWPLPNPLNPIRNPISYWAKIPARELYAIDYAYNTDLQLLEPLPSWGFNVIRLLFIWEAYEPIKGLRNPAYLRMLDRIVEQAWQLGIYTIIDFHQDGYSRHFAGPVEFKIWPPAADHKYGCGEGFPDWTLPLAEDRDPPQNGDKCVDWMANALSDPRVGQAFQKLYTDPELRHSYIQVVKDLVGHFEAKTGVIGLDLLNEPFAKKADSDLTDFYVIVTSSIGAAARDNSFILFLEPNLNVDSGRQTNLSPPPSANVAYAPHYYANLQPPVVGVDPQQAFRAMTGVAGRWHAPLFLGEFGGRFKRAFWDSADTRTWIPTIYEMLDKYMASGAQWSYTPGWSDSFKDGWDMEDLSIAIPDPGSRWGVTLRAIEYRPRPYPQAIGGIPKKLEVKMNDEGTWSLDLYWQSVAGVSNQTVIYVPNQPRAFVWGQANCTMSDTAHLTCTAAHAAGTELHVRAWYP